MKLPAAPQRFFSAAFELLSTNPALCLVLDLKSPLPNMPLSRKERHN